jgi:hypothetical protein
MPTTSFLPRACGINPVYCATRTHRSRFDQVQVKPADIMAILHEACSIGSSD